MVILIFLLVQPVDKKIKQTNTDKYGTDTPLKNSSAKKQIINKIQQTKHQRHNNKNFNNRDKATTTLKCNQL